MSKPRTFDVIDDTRRSGYWVVRERGADRRFDYQADTEEEAREVAEQWNRPAGARTA